MDDYSIGRLLSAPLVSSQVNSRLRRQEIFCCLQVQVRHFVCNGARACICGVAVREGNTVLAVDACESRLNPGTRFSVKIRQLSLTMEMGSSVTRSADGQEFAVGPKKRQHHQST